MIIKVLGSGCSNCKKLYENTVQAAKELSFSPSVEYVTDLVEIAKTGLMRTPGLVIDGKIVSYGRVPSSDEIKQMIQANHKE